MLGRLFLWFKFKDWPERFKAVEKLYEESPSIAAMPEGQAKYNYMTRKDFALLCVSIMSLAGMIGPTTLCKIVLGNVPLPDYEGEETGKIKVIEEWDKINLNDREEVKKYILECARLRHPVSNTHTIAREDFVAKVGNRNIKFKKGTIIFIPMILASIDRNVYGYDTFQFNHHRENLCPYSTIFHSFGEETNGRICPAKDVVLNMVIDILIALGNCRRDLKRDVFTDNKV